MAHKITKKKFLAFAKTLGYDGDAVDAAREFMTKGIAAGEFVVSFKNAEGTEFGLDDIEVVAPAHTLTLDEDPGDETDPPKEEVEEQKSAPEAKGKKAKASAEVEAKPETNIKGIVETAVQKALRAAGVGADQRPDMGGTKVVNNGDAKAIEYDRQAKMVAEGKRTRDQSVAFEKHWKSQLFGLELQAKFEMARHNPWALKNCMEKMEAIHREQGLKAAYNSNDLSVLNAQQYIPDLTNLVKEYGTARKVLRVVEMTSDTAKLPRASGALTVGYPASNGAPTTQTRSFDTINLTAKHGVILGQIPLDAMQDNLIDVGDDFAKECSRAFAKVEDDTWINGTGDVSSGYMPDVQGIATQFGLITSTDSRSFAGATTSDAHSDAQLTSFMALLGAFANVQNAAFYCSPNTAARVLFRLAKTMGGVTEQEYLDLGPVPRVFGRPVIYVHSMNSTNSATAGTIDMFYGDMRLAGTLGNRLAMQFEVSADSAFTSSALVLRARGRHDMVIHNIGSTSTESPVVALHQT